MTPAFAVCPTPGVTLLGGRIVALPNKSSPVEIFCSGIEKEKARFYMRGCVDIRFAREGEGEKSLLLRFSSLHLVCFYLYLLLNLLTAQNKPYHGQKLPFLVWFNYAAICAKFHNALDHTAVCLAA